MLSATVLQMSSTSRVSRRKVSVRRREEVLEGVPLGYAGSTAFPLPFLSLRKARKGSKE